MLSTVCISTMKSHGVTLLFSKNSKGRAATPRGLTLGNCAIQLHMQRMQVCPGIHVHKFGQVCKGLNFSPYQPLTLSMKIKPANNYCHTKVMSSTKISSPTKNTHYTVQPNNISTILRSCNFACKHVAKSTYKVCLQPNNYYKLILTFQAAV